jgi:HEAT repeat protein
VCEARSSAARQAALTKTETVTMTRSRKWALRAAGVAVMVAAAVGTWAGVNATELRAKFAARKLAAATTDDERATWADALAGYGEPGARELVECVKSGEEPARAAAAHSLAKYLDALPDNGPTAVAISGVLLDALPSASEPGKRAVLSLFPAMLKRAGGAHSRRCRAAVIESLKSPEPEVRLAAARLAIHPDIRVRAELKPLLSEPDPRIRGAALFAAASASDGEPTLGDEELFRWLHDPDAGVRKICCDALVARDRSEAEIALGRRLTHPDPAERLKLLLNLRYDEDVPDAEPWLERLSRDPEPAVRAGAARVAVEVAAARSSSVPAWVARVADADPHPTVRFVAAFYRAQPGGRPEPVRPVGAP